MSNQEQYQYSICFRVSGNPNLVEVSHAFALLALGSVLDNLGLLEGAYHI